MNFPFETNTKQVQANVHFNIAISCCDVWYRGFTLCFRPGLFPLFKQFLEIEMTTRLPIIVIECTFKNQNLCFESR